MDVVRFNNLACTDMSKIFCEDSGWGDEEATVVCREMYSKYGFGGKQVANYKYSNSAKLSKQTVDTLF